MLVICDLHHQLYFHLCVSVPPWFPLDVSQCLFDILNQRIGIVQTDIETHSPVANRIRVEIAGENACTCGKDERFVTAPRNRTQKTVKRIAK